jgi:hypothetical protein
MIVIVMVVLVAMVVVIVMLMLMTGVLVYRVSASDRAGAQGSTGSMSQSAALCPQRGTRTHALTRTHTCTRTVVDLSRSCGWTGPVSGNVPRPSRLRAAIPQPHRPFPGVLALVCPPPLSPFVRCSRAGAVRAMGTHLTLS